MRKISDQQAKDQNVRRSRHGGEKSARVKIDGLRKGSTKPELPAPRSCEGESPKPFLVARKKKKRKRAQWERY